MSSVREIQEGRQVQGAEENILYTLTVPSTWGTPTNGTVVVAVYSYINGVFADVTETAMPANVPSVSGQVISLSALGQLTADVDYFVTVKFDVDEGDSKQAFAWIHAER